MASQYVAHVQTWGTVIVLDVRADDVDERAAERACAAAAEELRRIDAWLSPFRTDSAVTAIRAGRMTRESAPEPVREVIDGCARVSELTGGAFDPWKAPGGFDPSGFVKGWGADRAAAVLVEHGFANVCVNAAGDVTCRGEGQPGLGGWRIGIADPRDRMQVIATALVTDAHLATSGRYEQGDHIVDPRTGRAVTSAMSASVLAPEGGVADALATALFVSGPGALPTVTSAGAAGYLVTDTRVWTTGRTFTPVPKSV